MRKVDILRHPIQTVESNLRERALKATPKIVRAKTLEDFAKKIRRATPPLKEDDYLGNATRIGSVRHQLSRAGVRYTEGAPIAEISASPTYPDGFELVHRRYRKWRRAVDVVYQEESPHPVDYKKRLQQDQIDLGQIEQLTRQSEAARELFRRNLVSLNLLQTPDNALRALELKNQADTRSDILSYRVRHTLAAHATAQDRISQLRQLLAQGERPINLGADFDYVQWNPRLMQQIIEENGGKPVAWPMTQRRGFFKRQ